jgi:hypothetical protein
MSCCLVVGSTSVILSYTLFSSEAWLVQFKYYGWIIETIRLVLLVISEGYIIGFVFEKESRQLFDLRVHRSLTLRLRLFRKITLFAFIFGIIYLVIYHLSIGPLWLASQQPSQLSFWQAYQIPYACYFFYTFIAYFIIALPILSIGLYGATKDLTSLRKTQMHFIGRLKNHILAIHEIERKTESNENFSREDQSVYKRINSEIQWDFEDFCLNFLDTIGRYTALVVFIAGFITFEYSVGKQTLSEPARIWLIAAFLLLTLIIISVCFGYLYYERAFHDSVNALYKSSRKLGGGSSEEYSKFLEKHNILKFMRRIFRRHIGLYFALILLSLVPPVTSFFEFILNRLLG